MATESDLYETMSILQNRLDTLIRNLRIQGEKLAESERVYKVALMKEVLKERDNGMPATLIDKVCYGKEEIAYLRSQRDIAKTIFQSTQESINATKLNMRIVDNQIARDYGQAR